MTRIPIAALAVLVSVSCTAAQEQQPASPAPVVLAPAPDTLLSRGRIAALPEPARTEWLRYVELSGSNAERDRAAMDAELRAAGRQTWTRAPAGRGFQMTDEMTEAWFRGDSARRLADVLVSYQTPSGGWSKRIEFAEPRQIGESWSAEERWTWVVTLDNGATTEQLRFLAGAIAAHDQPDHRRSFLEGIEYLLAAQQPTGCWPQAYPLMGSYHDAATYNDDATVHALQLLRESASGEHAWVPAELRARTAAAVERGIGCI
ncbi:MAG TPA: pectate lyase, partial [Longimicrobium sp.]|nr:pectate lyase [Longimicrobium sp.]